MTFTPHTHNLQHCWARLLTMLVVAHKHTTTEEILLWMIPSEPPKALQASECSELLDPMRASCLILAQHQPGKFKQMIWKGVFQAPAMRSKALGMENSAWAAPRGKVEGGRAADRKVMFACVAARRQSQGMRS